jgi:hypothetical protein
MRCSEITKWETSLIDEALNDVFYRVPLTIENPGGSLTYGELTWESLKYILSVLHSILLEEGKLDTVEKSFVDFGSGFGRVLLGVACMDHGITFSEFYGVEIDACMHHQALEALNCLKEHPIGRALLGESKVTLLCEDGLQNYNSWNLESCDVLYICCTCFDATLSDAIASLVERHLPEGSFVITTTRRLNAPCLINMRSFSAECTWGHASIFIDMKVSR